MVTSVSQLSRSVDHVVMHQRRVVVVDRDRRIIKGRKEILTDVGDLRRGIIHAVHDIADMAAVQFFKAAFYHLCWFVFSHDPDRRLCRRTDIDKELPDRLQFTCMVGYTFFSSSKEQL